MSVFVCSHTGADMPCMRCDNEMLVADNEKLRAEIRYVVTQEFDDVCWLDVYQRLGKLVGIEFNPLLLPEEKHVANCRRFHQSLATGCNYETDPWSDSPPSQPGWHWFRFVDSAVPFIVLLSGGVIYTVLSVNGKTEWLLDDWPAGQWKQV